MYAPCTAGPWDHAPFTLALLGPAGSLNVLLSLLPLYQPDEDLFNPDYVEVDRILEVAHTKDSDTGEVSATAAIQLLLVWMWGGQRLCPGEAQWKCPGRKVLGPARSCGLQECWFQCSYRQVTPC